MSFNTLIDHFFAVHHFGFSFFIYKEPLTVLFPKTLFCNKIINRCHVWELHAVAVVFLHDANNLRTHIYTNLIQQCDRSNRKTGFNRCLVNIKGIKSFQQHEDRFGKIWRQSTSRIKPCAVVHNNDMFTHFTSQLRYRFGDLRTGVFGYN